MENKTKYDSTLEWYWMRCEEAGLRTGYVTIARRLTRFIMGYEA